MSSIPGVNPGSFSGLSQVELKNESFSDFSARVEGKPFQYITAAFEEWSAAQPAGSSQTMPGVNGEAMRAGSSVSFSISDDNLQSDMSAFFALFAQISQTVKSVAKEMRDASMDAQVTLLNASAVKILDAAQARFDAASSARDFAMAAGAVQIGFAALQMTMAVASGVNSARSGSAMTIDEKGISSPNATSRTFDGLSTQQSGSAQAFGQLGTAVSGMLQAEAQFRTAKGDLAAAQIDSSKALIDAAAKKAEAAYQNFQDAMQKFQDLLKQAAELGADVNNKNVEGNKGIARNV